MSRCYADCFRILGEAIKDGIISDWWYGAKQTNEEPGIDVYLPGGKIATLRDTDGTKGDIGLFRESADYVMGLRSEQAKCYSSMTPLALEKWALAGDELEYKCTLRPGSCAYIVLENNAATVALQVFTRRVPAEKVVDSE